MVEPAQNAIAAVSDVSKTSGAGGLWMLGHRSEDELGLSAALPDAPADGNEIVEDDGAVAYLDPAAADALTRKRLDSRVSDGPVYLSLIDQS